MAARASERLEEASEAIEGLDSARAIAEAALSVMQGVLKAGQALPFVGDTCKVLSGGAWE